MIRGKPANKIIGGACRLSLTSLAVGCPDLVYSAGKVTMSK